MPTAIALGGIFSYASTVLSGIGFGFIAEHWGWTAAYLEIFASALLGTLALRSKTPAAHSSR